MAFKKVGFIQAVGYNGACTVYSYSTALGLVIKCPQCSGSTVENGTQYKLHWKYLQCSPCSSCYVYDLIKNSKTENLYSFQLAFNEIFTIYSRGKWEYESVIKLLEA